MNAERPNVRAGLGTLKLGLFAMLAAAIVAAAWQVTHERIAQNEREAQRRLFAPVLAGVAFDTIDLSAPTVIAPPHTLPGETPALVYTATLSEQPVARVFEVDARGYNGPIRMMIGIDGSNTVTGVRVIAHAETPGLGDAIEITRSEWIETFRGKSLQNVAVDGWRLKREGGEFDGFTGASITPHAVVDAVFVTLTYARRHPLNGDAT